jgi:hypothetical protein
MKRQTKQTSREAESLAATQRQEAAAQEFATPEDLLRHDARQTLVPPGIAERLGKTIQNEPKPERSWWRRWLGQ